MNSLYKGLAAGQSGTTRPATAEIHNKSVKNNKPALFMRWMLALLMIVSMGATAQVSSLVNPTYGYTFVNSLGTYTTLSGGTVFQTGAAITTNTVSGAIALPFTFTFNGIKENTIYISNNGFITFATAPDATNYTPLSTITTSGYDGAIAGSGMNCLASTASGVSPEIRYGTNGGGDFVVQFQDLGLTSYTAVRITYQITLKADGKTVQIVYGPNNVGVSGASQGQVGLRGTNDEDYNNRTLASGGNWNTAGGAAGSANTSAMSFTSSTTLPVSGRTFTWNPTAYAPSYLANAAGVVQEFTSWVNGSGPSNVPSTNFATNGYGNASWQIDNNPGTTTTTGWGSQSSYGYTPVDYVNAVGGHSARFHSGNTNSPQVGYLDYYVDLSAVVGTPTLDFFHINTSGTDILQVFLSTDGGTTFAQIGSNIGVSAAWTAKSISLGGANSATTIIRFKATADFGSTDIGIDHMLVTPPPAMPTISSFAPNNNLCAGGGQIITITGTNFSGSTIVTFNGVNAASFVVVNNTTITAVTPAALTSGTIDVTNPAGTATSGAYTVAANPVVTVSPSSATFCSPGGTAVTLTAGGASTYTWLPTAGLTPISGSPVDASPATATTYTVTGTDGNGCTGTATSTITVSANPVLSSITATPATVCSGSNSQLQANVTTNTSAALLAYTATPGQSLEAIPSPTTVTTPTSGTVDDGYITVTPGFTFSFLGTNYTSFGVGTNGYIVLGGNATTIPSSLTSVAGNVIYAFGRDGNLNTANGGDLTHGLSSGGDKYVFQMNKYSGGGSGGASATIYVTYQIVLWGATSSSPGRIDIIYDANAGTPGSAGTIGVKDAAGKFTNGVNGSTTLTTTAAAWPASGQMYSFEQPALTYLWTPNTFLDFDNIANPLASAVTATTTYTVTATQVGCSATGNVTVTVSTGAAIVTEPAASTTVCAGTAASFTVVASGPSLTYQWRKGGVDINTISNPSAATANLILPGVTAADIDTYDVVVTAICGSPVTSAGAALDVITTLVGINAPITTICSGNSVTLTENGGNATSWSWAPGGATTQATTESPLATTTYTVTATLSGCSVTATQEITVNPTPSAVTVTPSTPTICAGGNVNLTATGGDIVVTGNATIGAGVTLTSPATTDPTAFNNRYAQYYAQMVYTAAELQAQGLTIGSTITSISFNVTTLGDAATNANFRISLGTIGATSTLTGFTNSGLTLVYGSTATTYTHGLGVNTITLSSPYVWNGGNLLLEMKHSGVDNLNNATTYYTATGTNTVWNAQTSTPFSTSDYATTSPSGAGSTKRLNTVFGYDATQNASFTWLPGTGLNTPSGPAVIATPTVTTTYTATSTINGCSSSNTSTVTVNPNYDITATTGANGTVSPLGVTTLSCDGTGDQIYTITPDACYSIADVLVDGVSVGTGNTYTFTDVTANHTISASFVLSTYSITVSSGANGSITPATGSVNCGDNATYTITPDACYSIADVLVDGVSVGTSGTYTFTNVTAAHTISASFVLNTYTITVTAGANGSITPATGSVNCGDNATYTITPDACYSIADLIVDGVSVGTGGTYTFTNVTAAHTISATFSAVPAASAGTVSGTSPLCIAGTATYSSNGDAGGTWASSNTGVATVDVNTGVVTGVSQGTANITYTVTGLCGGPSSASQSVTVQTLDYANLQFPAAGTICSSGSLTAYGQVYEAGVTEAGGQGAGITVEIGYNATNNTDPSTWTNWSTATFNVQVGNNDEYQANIGNGFAPGTYYYTFRYSLNGCAFQYGGYSAGGGSFWDGSGYVSGVLTVSPNANAGTVTGTSPLCADATATYISNGDAGGTWSSSNPGVASVNSTTGFVTAIAAGTTDITYTVNSGCNAPASAFQTLTVNANYSITASAGANGNISPNGVTTLSCDGTGDQTYTITADACYSIADVLVDGVSVGTGNTYTFTDVTTNHTISASFVLNTYTITVTAGANGSITPATGSVNCGDNATFTITPDACYSIADVIVDGVSVGTGGTYTFTNVTAAHTISASFVLNTYTITVTAGANGAITPATGSVNCGDNATYTITPDACYSIADVIVDGVSVGTGGTYTFTNVTAAHTISATFVVDTYTITVTSGANGSVTPATGSVNCGANATYTITADPGYAISDVIVDGVSQGAVGAYTFFTVSAPHTISATFALDNFVITSSAGAGGTISPLGNTAVNAGGTETFTITANNCFSIADVIVDGVSQGAIGTYTFSNVSASHTISASFTQNGPYTITVTAGANGTVTPGTGSVNCGDNATYTISANTCYSIVDVIVDGVSQGAIGTYTFTNVQAAHSISATFVQNAPLTAPVVSGPVNVCPFEGTLDQLTYSVPANPNVTSFVWIVPPTVTLVSGQGTNSIMVTINNGFAAAANKQIRVTALSSCGNSPQTIYYLLAQAPGTPAPITGNTNVCAIIGTPATYTYSIAAVPGAVSYIWLAQAGTTVVTNNGTSADISFTNGFTSSAVTVQAVNGCGTSSARSITVLKVSPSTPGLISGPTNACEFIAPTGTAATYSVVPVSGATSYTWTTPAGAIGLTGQGTTSISFTFPIGFTSGSVTVTATSGCGTSGVRSLSISKLNAATPGIIDVIQTGSCPARIYTYTIASTPANSTSVFWTIPAGGTILSGQGTTSIAVSYPGTAINGNVTAQSFNNCSSSTIRVNAVKLPACPPEEPRSYSKANSTVQPVETMSVNVYPNPSVSDFKLQVVTAAKEKITVRILDLQGRSFKSITVQPYQTTTIGSDLKAGAYMMEVKQGNSVKTTKLIKF